MNDFDPNQKCFPLRRIQGKIIEDDFNYIISDLCGGKQGMQTEILMALFHKLAKFLKDQKLQPYSHDRTTRNKVKRLLRIVECRLPESIKPASSLP